jgi:hypothetical protein
MKAPSFEGHGNCAHVTTARGEILRLPPQEPHFDWIGFSEPMRSTWFWSMRWLRFRPATMKSGEGSVLSTNLLRRIVDDQMQHMMGLIDVLRRTTPVFVVEAPWPFRHHPHVKINGAELVAHLHAFHREHVTALLSARNVRWSRSIPLGWMRASPGRSFAARKRRTTNTATPYWASAWS